MNGLWILILLFLVGCASEPPAPTPAETVLGAAESASKSWAASFWKEQALREQVMSNVKGRLKLTYQGPKERVLGRGFVIARYPTASRLELRDPFGKLHFQSMLWGRDFLAMYPTAKVAYTDKSGGQKYFRRTLGINIGFDDLHALSIGILPPRFRACEQGQGLKAGTLQLKCPEGELQLWVHAEYLTLEKIIWKRGENQLAVKYADYRPCCKAGEKHAVAQWMELTEATSRVEIEWQDLKTEEVSAQESFYRATVPSDFKSYKLE